MNTESVNREGKHSEYSPIVSELAGILSLPEDYDYKSDYLEHLEQTFPSFLQEI